MQKQEKQITKEENICANCIHKDYCFGAFKKKEYCGNYTERMENEENIRNY